MAGLAQTEQFTIQDRNVSSNNQIWLVNGTPTNINPGTSNSYWTVPVSLVSSSGTGTTGFTNNHPLFLAIINGISGYSGPVSLVSSSGTGTTGLSDPPSLG